MNRGPVSITLLPVEAGDAEALVMLRVEAMRESLERIGRFDPERARARLLDSFEVDHTRHIEFESRRVGFVVVKPRPDSLLLDHLAIARADQGRGIGTAVLLQVFAEAQAQRLAVRVTALRGSDANRFYRRHGFRLVEQGEWDNHYLRLGKPVL